MNKDEQYQALKNKALNLLSRREHACTELKTKLSKASRNSGPIDEQLVEQLLIELQELNYLSDQRYADMLVRSRFNRGHGPLRVRQELAHHQLDSQTQILALESFEGDWFELASQARAKRFGDYPQDFKERAKQMRFLAGRGFTSEQIDHALSETE